MLINLSLFKTLKGEIRPCIAGLTGQAFLRPCHRRGVCYEPKYLKIIGK